jgi:pimeloyl-ACP methyl ester carboxylesterase
MNPLLLLHGALGDASQFDDLIPRLSRDFEILRLTFAGHGTRPPGAGSFGIGTFTQNVIDFLDENGVAAPDIFGYSMGGYVALHLAKTHPARVRRIFTLGTELPWTPARAARDVKMLDADTIVAKVPHFARQLEARHTALGWRELLRCTAAMLSDLGAHPPLTAEDFAALPHRVRIAVGDRDTTAGVTDSYEVFTTLPNGEFQVLPNTPHPFERADLDGLAVSITKFFA